MAAALLLFARAWADVVRGTAAAAGRAAATATWIGARLGGGPPPDEARDASDGHGAGRDTADHGHASRDADGGPPGPESSLAEPLAIDPTHNEPTHKDPAHADPAHADPPGSDPAHNDPAHADPPGSDPAHNDPAQVGPPGSDPAHVDPAHVDVDPAALRAGFLASQLAKYLPGGIWQPLGVVALAARAGVPARDGGRAFARFAAAYALAGAAAGGPLLALGGTHLAGAARVALAIGGALALAALVTVAVGLHGWTHGPPATALAALGGGLVAWGLAFAAVAEPLLDGGTLDHPPSLVTLAGAGILGWLAGFVAVPVPAGAGVREAALVALLPGPAAPIVAASLAHRAAGLAAELVLAATTRRHLRRQ